MRKLLHSIKRAWYIFRSPSMDRAMYVHRMYGKFKVLYPDGQYSQPMGFGTAKNYAEIFGGKVVDNF